MKDNKLIVYKERIFSKITNFFKKLFHIGKKEEQAENVVENDNQREEFISRISIKEDDEENRIKRLKLEYENGEISEEDMLEEDMEKLIEIYNNETEKLNEDTERRKMHISEMLKKLKVGA